MFELKLAQFENEDKRLPPKLALKTNCGYFYFTNYIQVGYEIVLRQGDRDIGRLTFSDKPLQTFKSQFEKILNSYKKEIEQWKKS